MNHDKLEKRLKLYREIAADHPPGESRRRVERACEELESRIKGKELKTGPKGSAACKNNKSS